MYRLYNMISLNPSKLNIVCNNLNSFDEEKLSELNEDNAPLIINTNLFGNTESLSNIMLEKRNNNRKTCKEYMNYGRINDAFSKEIEESFDESRISKSF